MAKTLKCPFTGETVSIRKTKCGALEVPRWFGIVESPLGGYSTTMFQYEEQLIDFFNMRGGVLKGKSAQAKIVVTHPDTFAGQIEDEAQKERDLDDAAQTSASSAVKHARDTGLVKPDR